MKEIIYIQNGNFANYIGSHFWNTQESYFTYEKEADSVVDHDVSFREGQNLKGESTFCPRLLLFDRKVNFGAVSSGLYVDEEEAGIAHWNGDIVEHKQEPIPKSIYHESIEQENSTENSTNVDTDSNIRYWSDYDRVFYHPRSLHRLPDVPDYENTEGDWSGAQQTFRKYDEDVDVMETSFRLFAEECDHLQGIQVTSDNGSFGGFTHSFLAAFRDEFPRLSSLTFSVLSNAHGDNDIGLREIMNDALCLQSFMELSTITVPIQDPSSWTRGPWLEDLRLNRYNPYHSSALVSSHIESVTLPLRLKQSQDDLNTLCETLSVQTNARIAHLSGLVPLPETSKYPHVEKRIYDLSALTQSSYSQVFSRIDVSRGFSLKFTDSYETWRASRRRMVHSIHAPAIPLPSSYPSFFTSPTRSPSCSAFSSLATTPQTSVLFSQYATHVDNVLKRHPDVIQRMDLEIDDIKELRDEMWALEDEYKGDSEITAADNFGENEQ